MKARFAGALAVFGAALFGLAGSAAGQNLKPMKLTLNNLAGGPQFGFILGKKLGYYREVGIDLEIEEGKGSGPAVQLTATGRADVGYADAATMANLRSKGAPVKIIATITQANAFALIWLENSGIKSIEDLIGKKVGTQTGQAQSNLLPAVFASRGIDPAKVEIVNLDGNALTPALAQGSVQAISGGADYQTGPLRARGFKFTQINYRDIGVTTASLSIIATEKALKDNPDLYRRFVAATLRGYLAARATPDAAAQALVEQFPTAQKDAVLRQFEPIAQLYCMPGAPGFGRVSEKEWARSYEVMTKYMGLPRSAPITEYYTNDFLPAQLPACPK